MRLASVRVVVIVPALVGMFVLSASRMVAQNSDTDWHKDYSVGGGAALTVETSDSSLDIHSCGDCKMIRIHVIAGEKLTNFRLEERQEQNHVYFSLKEKPHVGFEIHWKEKRQAIVKIRSQLRLVGVPA